MLVNKLETARCWATVSGWGRRRCSLLRTMLWVSLSEVRTAFLGNRSVLPSSVIKETPSCLKRCAEKLQAKIHILSLYAELKTFAIDNDSTCSQ